MSSAALTCVWRPSFWGRRITRSPDWTLRLVDECFELFIDGETHSAPIDGEPPFRLNKGLIWSDLRLHRAKVGGLPNRLAKQLEDAISNVISEQRRRTRLDTFSRTYSLICGWLETSGETIRKADQERRWITYEQQQALLSSRPELPIQEEALWALFLDPDVQSTIIEPREAVESRLNAWRCDWPSAWTVLNEQHTRRELVVCKDLFDQVESKPLTEEQARAVICFDNRVQVIASAGSGKTSTMVAKAAYAIHRGFVSPGRIVLLAFNTRAAEELKERAARSFERLSMEGIEIEASTFHALGLRIIGKATGRRPDVPEWAVDTPSGLRKLTEIVDELKDRSASFRSSWDLFRLVFGRDLPPFGTSGPVDAWDRDGNGYICTTRGDRVRSLEECMIANWLFYNGVNYCYERRYEFNTATETYRQYKPDFYYPDVELYHEHFALDAKGRPPRSFNGYMEGVAWKRQVHGTHGTPLIETTSHQLREGDWMGFLSKELTDRGIVLDPNPDRPIPNGGKKPMENTELVVLVRTFISHAKSNCLTIEALAERLESLPEGSFKHRNRIFLDIVGPILTAWDAALADEDGIDFEDMLNLAAQCLEQGRYKSPYNLVMADEFQDASRARARLCKALVQEPGRHFFAVGDDWQSINRFAGADISVMTSFGDVFGHYQLLRLQQTFRCPQALCDVSSRFVTRNPAQIKKHVLSLTQPRGPVLQAFQVKHRAELQSAIDGFLGRIHQGLLEGSIPPGPNGKLAVFILGRYNADKSYVPDRWKVKYGTQIELSFHTIHRSKGSEADYVILPAMVSSRRNLSFPDTRADDPVLALAMPAGDSFPLGEERRLFYVALTRARRSVAIFTVCGQSSSFLDELVKDRAVTVITTEGDAVQEQRCPVCKQGVIVAKSGPYGEFKACSNYPDCEHKPRNAAMSAASIRGA